MELQVLPFALTVCKVSSLQDIDFNSELYFVGKTDEEISLVCPTGSVPQNTIAREDGWRGFRICGVLDFSLVGILAKISKVLADHSIGLFAVSTFNTDYILVKGEQLEEALQVLARAGYTISESEKKTAYQALIQEVRESYQSEPGGLKWCDDCQEINLWTYWQGRGNLDAKIMLVGQDWGNPWTEDMQGLMNRVRAMNENNDTPYIQDFDNPTDVNLIRLLQSIGYDIVNVKNKDLFFTNFVLGYRTKGISGNFQKEWAEHDKGYFARLVNIIEPETILCLGRDTFAGVLTAFPDVIPPKIQSYNRFIESKDNPVELSLPNGRKIRIFALAHCGKLGTLNRNRGEADKTSLQKQIEDWSRIL